jgi:Polyketide cyclase / dehydrase and lipid transport
MASIHKEIFIESPADTVWAAFRDIGAVHTRLAPGFVTDCRLDGRQRVVAFANGFVVREVIVDLDDAARRLAYSARSEKLEHHNAYFQVIPMGERRCRVVWVADLLPDEAAESIGGMMEQGSLAMKRALEGAADAALPTRID